MSSDLFERAKRIFDRVADLPPEERPAFIKDACGENTVVQSQVERMLAEFECENPIFNPPISTLHGKTPENQSLVGTNRSKMRQPLGSGAFETVHEVYGQERRAVAAPWWLYLIVVSFLFSFGLHLYNFLWGIAPLGFQADYRSGSMIVDKIITGEAADRAGLRKGDQIASVNGVTVRDKSAVFDFYYHAAANFELQRPIQLQVDRQGRQIELAIAPRLRSVRDLTWEGWQRLFTVTFTFALALMIFFRRRQDTVALVGAWLLATMAVDPIFLEDGWASLWRHQPSLLGVLLWPMSISRGLIAGLSISFVMLFPRKLISNRLVWILILSPVVLIAALQNLAYWQVVYRPQETPYALGLVSLETIHRLNTALGMCYIFATALVLWVQYRRLSDINERRKTRILIAGAVICSLTFSALLAAKLFTNDRTPGRLDAITFIFYASGPLALAYAVLRHRVLDLGVILRRGLQYALARKLLISAVPLLAVLFFLDLLVHNNQSTRAALQSRGWLYFSLAALAIIAYTQRQNWLDTLDRCFFREHYDARRLLRAIVEEMRAAPSLANEAPLVLSRIEKALHPEFAGMLVCESTETFYRTLFVVPPEKRLLPLKKESKLLSLIRLLGKPLEVPETESGWLQQQLPQGEVQFLSDCRIGLLVPIVTDLKGNEILLVLGSKRSEEPYSAEDQDLLATIAASIAILATRVSSPRDVFEECPRCGICYEDGTGKCISDGTRLKITKLPRVLGGRYGLDRRLGRGGMGTVYAASDKLLERCVAVKVIREDLIGSQSVAERFRREARTAAGFTHPNVVTVYDYGVEAESRAYLVMEVLQGRTLREELQSQPRLPITRLLNICRGIGNALTAAHRRRLVHRDLKPENVFLVASETSEIAKVLDFGIAKLLSNVDGWGTLETVTGAILGTPRYMSPEQRSGQEAHHTWDIWALAVMAYEMLTGYYPFDGIYHDCITSGSTVPFIPITKYFPQAGERWQLFFEHSFACELSNRHDSVESFLLELRDAAQIDNL